MRYAKEEVYESLRRKLEDNIIMRQGLEGAVKELCNEKI